MQDVQRGIVIGKVADNADPDQLGRVSIVFPWLPDDEPRWMSVASPMAGDGRGLFVMPEIDDEALVAFDQGDFAHGYVVGFLWNTQHRPPTTSPNARGLYSREGHAVQLLDAEERDGNKGAVVINDAHGNGMVMTNGVVSIFSAGVLTIDAPSVVIKGRVVNPLGGPV